MNIMRNDFDEQKLLFRLDVDDFIENEKIFGYQPHFRVRETLRDAHKAERRDSLQAICEKKEFFPTLTVGFPHTCMLMDLHEQVFGKRRIDTSASSVMTDAGNAIDFLSRTMGKKHPDYDYFVGIIEALEDLYHTYNDYWLYRRGYEDEIITPDTVINLTKKIHRKLGSSLSNKHKTLLLSHETRWIPFNMYKSLNIVLKNSKKDHHSRNKSQMIYPDLYYMVKK